MNKKICACIDQFSLKNAFGTNSDICEGWDSLLLHRDIIKNVDLSDGFDSFQYLIFSNLKCSITEVNRF